MGGNNKRTPLPDQIAIERVYSTGPGRTKRQVVDAVAEVQTQILLLDVVGVMFVFSVVLLSTVASCYVQITLRVKVSIITYQDGAQTSTRFTTAVTFTRHPVFAPLINPKA